MKHIIVIELGLKLICKDNTITLLLLSQTYPVNLRGIKYRLLCEN